MSIDGKLWLCCAGLLLVCSATTLKSPTSSKSPSTTRVIKGVSSDGIKSSIVTRFRQNKYKKPLLPPLISHSSKNGSSKPLRKLHVAGGKSSKNCQNSNITDITDIVRNANPNPSTCSLRLHRITVGNGDCAHEVFTKLCHGECTSHTSVHRSSFRTIREALQSVESTCNRCTGAPMLTRRHTMTCKESGGTRSKRITYRVPYADHCSCRPCSC